MESEDNKTTIESFYRAFNRRDRAAYCELLHPEFEAEISGSGEVSGQMDREAFSQLVFERVEEIFPGGLQVSLLQLIAEADSVASRVTVSGKTQRGEPYRNPACHVFRLCDGRIAEMIEYFDTALSRAAFEQARESG